ncbi:MAG TPA: tetratricopeptide repeat protein [Burkholderiales bacterium]
MQNRTLLPLVVLLAGLTLSGQPAVAAGGGGGESTAPAVPEDPDYAAGKRAVEAKNWQAALDAFNKVAAKDPGNANAQNYLGYTYRKSGKLDLAFKHYEEALRLNPMHRGAHEYMGEAYLMTGNLAKAEEHLQALDRLCFFGCEEYSELKEAVAEYKQKTANK